MTVRFLETRFLERLRALGGNTDRSLHVLEEIDSTSDELRRRLCAGEGPGTIVVAHRQTRGRGRVGRTWHAPPEGNLSFSIAVELAGPTAETVPLLPLAAGIAAHKAVDETGASAALKWPNDVLIDGRKLAGILCETARLSPEGALAIVGIGVNIADRPFPKEIEEIAVSLNRVLGSAANISALAARFTACLETWAARINAGERRAVPVRWKQSAEPFGRRVQVGDVIGNTADLAPDGRLIVVDDAGTETLIAGGIVESLDLI